MCPRVILIGSHLHLLPYSFLLNNKRRSIILIKYVEANELHFHNFNDSLWERRGVKMDIVSLETIFWISVGSSSSVRTSGNDLLNLCWFEFFGTNREKQSPERSLLGPSVPKYMKMFLTVYTRIYFYYTNPWYTIPRILPLPQDILGILFGECHVHCTLMSSFVDFKKRVGAW